MMAMLTCFAAVIVGVCSELIPPLQDGIGSISGEAVVDHSDSVGMYRGVALKMSPCRLPIAARRGDHPCSVNGQGSRRDGCDPQ